MALLLDFLLGARGIFAATPYSMNNAGRAFLIAMSAAASSDDAPAPPVPQKSEEDGAEACRLDFRDADGSRAAIDATHVDATCDLVSSSTRTPTSGPRATTTGTSTARGARRDARSAAFG